MHILYIRQVQQPSLVLYEENCGKRLLICRATEAWQQRTQPVISQFFPWKVLVQLYIGSECTKEGYFSCCGLRYVSLYHLKIRGPIGLCKTVTLVRIDRHQLGWKLHRSLLNAAVSARGLSDVVAAAVQQELRLSETELSQSTHIYRFFFALGEACGLLYHRLVNLKQQIFDCRTGFPRPKPIEAMGLFGIIFNFLRMIHAAIMVSDAAPNVAFRSFIFEFPWQFGIAALACYMFGVAHTLSDSSKVIYEAWIRIPKLVDGICVLVITTPFISNNICSIAAGVFALRGNNELAAKFTSALYYLWTFYTGFLALLILYAGIRLLRLLSHHLLQRKDDRVDIAKIKLGALKVKIIILTGFGCLALFAVVLGLYGALRDPIQENTAYNLTIAMLWTYDGVIATAFIEFSVILNPRIASLGGSGFGSVAGSSNRSATAFTNSAVASRGFTGSKNDRVTSGMSLTKWDDTLRSSYKKSFDIENLKNGSRTSHPRLDFTGLSTEVEQEQLRYNTMTNQVRAPPRHGSPTSLDEQRRHFAEALKRTDPDPSEISTTSSASNLVLHPQMP
ncbi:hypothetical protein VTP01DRAFT_5440 [Rhizomucor pusillus]|uniref:uncharacterized protein n=1 Tax=Rhizomucor pusillus TaxID=4840 RepID=UPI00374356C6